MSDFRATRLWRAALAQQPRDEHKLPRERLRNALERFRERAAVLAGEIPQDVRSLTVHDITHIDALWETAEVIMGDTVSLTPTEAFVLGGAFLIHDLGLGLAAYPGGLSELQARPEWNDLLISALRAELGREPDANEVTNPPGEVLEDVKFRVLRVLHAEQAERLALISWAAAQSGEQFHLLEDPEMRAAFGPLIGRVAHSHWWDVALLPEKFPRQGPEHQSPSRMSGRSMRLNWRWYSGWQTLLISTADGLLHFYEQCGGPKGTLICTGHFKRRCSRFNAKVIG
jgi:hypothetical protein